MPNLLALLSSAAYGAADFLGGLASRRAAALAVVVTSQLYGVLFLLALLPVLPPDRYTWPDLGWGAAAGIAGGLGLVSLYRGLSIGRMGIVAPVTAAVGAVISAAFGLVSGERPSSLAVVGSVVALAAIVLVGRNPAATEAGARSVRGVSGLRHALAAGTGFGGFFILVTRAGDTSGLWPLMGARLGSLAVLGVIAVGSHRTFSIRRTTNRLVVGAGFLDIGANALFLYATRGGLLTLVAILSSLYPAVTVLLARVFLAERLQAGQVFGVGLAVAGIALIAAG